MNYILKLFVTCWRSQLAKVCLTLHIRLLYLKMFKNCKTVIPLTFANILDLKSVKDVVQLWCIINWSHSCENKVSIHFLTFLKSTSSAFVLSGYFLMSVRYLKFQTGLFAAAYLHLITHNNTITENLLRIFKE